MPLPEAEWTPTMEQYHQDPAWGSSMLSDLRDNRRLARELYVTKTIAPEPPTGSMKLGTMVHSMIEGASTGVVPLYVAVEGDRRGKAYRDAIKSGLSPAVVYPQAEIDAATAIAYAIINPQSAAARAAAGILVEHPGVSEYSLRWQHSPHVELKARYDRLSEVPGVGWCSADLKTSRDPAPASFVGSVKAYHYIHALALREMGAAMLGIEIAGSFLVAVRSEAPHEVCVYQPDAGALAYAREALRVELLELEELLAADDPAAWAHSWEGSVTPLTAEEIT